MIQCEASEVSERSKEGRENGLSFRIEQEPKSSDASVPVSRFSLMFFASRILLTIERLKTYESDLPLESIDGEILEVSTLSNDDLKHGSSERGDGDGEGFESGEVCREKDGLEFDGSDVGDLYSS